MTTTHILGVLIGGGLGSVVRYLVTYAMLQWCPDYRGLGTLIVNIVGCLVIGFLAGAGVEHKWLSTEWRIFLVTGVLGGLTTFSSFALETALLSRPPGSMMIGFGHIAANLLLGLAAVLIGERLATLWTV